MTPKQVITVSSFCFSHFSLMLVVLDSKDFNLRWKWRIFEIIKEKKGPQLVMSNGSIFWRRVSARILESETYNV